MSFHYNLIKIVLIESMTPKISYQLQFQQNKQIQHALTEQTKNRERESCAPSLQGWPSEIF